ncbi:MAG: NACHT domain-containing protein, partial [Cyanobacteria bacterium J06631_2]
LESLDSSGYIYDKELKIYQVFMPQKVKEFQEYLPQVYELPKDLQQRLRERGELEREIQPEELERYKRAYTNQQIRSVLEVIADDKYQYLVILGDPGSGKSTLLQYLAVEWAKLPAKDLPNHPLTILIELQKYVQDFAANRCQNFLEYLHQGSNWICHLNQNELDNRLKHQPATILFDGLDEVFDPNLRASIVAQIHNFTQTYPAAKVIVTSRIIGYKPQQLKDAEFHHFMLQDLEPNQIQDFLEKWHDLTYDAVTESQKKQDRQQRITKAVKDSPAIQQLAGNPLLLTMMAILNRNQDLPRDRAKLYERSSELLLYQWDVEAKLLEEPELKGIDIDYSDKQAMLWEVAHFMQATEQGLTGNLISHQDLRQILTDYLKTIDVRPPRKVAKLMIEQLRTRNFILCDVGGGYYAFVHRTFLEYFCAWSYIYQLEAQALSIDQIKTAVFGKHWQDESWHEVLRLIAGMILDPLKVGEIIEYLMAQEGESANYNNLFLAADCLSELRSRKSITIITDRLLAKLKRFVQEVRQFTEQSDDEDLNQKLSSKVIKAIANNWNFQL